MSETQSPLMKTSRRTFVILLVVAIVAYVTIISGFKHLKAPSTDLEPVLRNISLKLPRRGPFIDDQTKRHNLQNNEYFQQTESMKTVNAKQNGTRKRVIAQSGWRDHFHNRQTIKRPGLIGSLRYIVGDIHNVSVDEINSSKVISYAKIVVVIAYMRSGSTLVGKLIQQHPNTFYLFEPIRTIIDAFKDDTESKSTLRYLDGENRRYDILDKMKVVLQEIINWVTCQLEELSIESLTNSFHKLFTTQMKIFYRCALVHFERLNLARTVQTRLAGLTSYTSHLFHIYDCLKDTALSCRESSLMALKLIRMRMRDLEPLLPLFPNMKIIHLNRDPRGIFNSRSTLRKRLTVTEFAKQHCNDVADDLSASKYILLKYPGRLKMIYYENLAETPILTAQEIYDFIGIEFTNTVRSFVQTTTSSQSDTCKFCTERKNSTETASRWRQNMADKRGFNRINVIQTQCKDSNRVLGYLPFSSTEKLRNAEIPSRNRINVTKALLGDTIF